MLRTTRSMDLFNVENHLDSDVDDSSDLFDASNSDESTPADLFSCLGSAHNLLIVLAAAQV